MMNEFFDPGSERVAKVNRLFTRIARRYDLLNDIQSFGLHRLWKRRVVEMAQVCAGARALDVCCGTGDLAFALSSRGAETLGLDFNESMLQVAQQRNGSALYPNKPVSVKASPAFLIGDAQQLPFPTDHFEIVTVGYGLRNLRHWQSGLREMVRVARPKGRLLVLDFGKPDNAVWRFVYFGYLRLFVPVLGLLFCGSASAYAYILESLRYYPAQNGVAAEMRQLGLKNVRVLNLLGGMMSINYGEKV